MTDQIDQITAAIGGGAGAGGGGEPRSTSQAELRRKARERVARGAANGESPSRFRSADLDWCYGTSPEAAAELDRLEQLAESARDERAERSRRIRASSRVRDLAEKIIKDQAKQLADDRMAAAIEEAKRRLGIADEGETES